MSSEANQRQTVKSISKTAKPRYGKSCALAMLITSLLSSASLVRGQQIDNLTTVTDAQTYESAPDAQALTTRIVTGAAPNDDESWWNCSIATRPAVKNLHLRLWQSGAGFSGHHKLTWKARTATSIDISIGQQTFTLANILFRNSSDKTDYFHAIDSNQAEVECEWSGPPRNSVENTVQLDQGSHLLATQLTAASIQSWHCLSRDAEGNTAEHRLLFNNFGLGVRNSNDNFSWHIDTRFNVIMSFKNQVSVLRDIRFESTSKNSDSFEAYELATYFKCSKAPT